MYLRKWEKCNVEVQQSDNDDHVRRVRYNASSIAVKDSQKNEKFEQIEDIIVVYISQFDIFKANRVLYHVDSTNRETGQRIEDGLYRVFVNTEVKDGTTISEYMECFLKKEVNNSKFPEFTDRMNVLKHEERGLDAVCEVMEKYEQKAIAKANVDAIKFMITTLNASKEQILQQYSEYEYHEALNELSKNRKVCNYLKGPTQLRGGSFSLPRNKFKRDPPLQQKNISLPYIFLFHPAYNKAYTIGIMYVFDIIGGTKGDDRNVNGTGNERKKRMEHGL